MIASFGDVSIDGSEREHVAFVQICRGPNNYFDTALVGDIANALEQLANAGGWRAVVLTSEGRNFCAGASLSSATGGLDGSAEPVHLYDEALRIFASPLPMVIAVNGAAIGGGLGLALAGDFRVGSAQTRLSANFARLGFHHGFGTTVTLPAVVGQQRALELLYTGRRLNGREAHALGLLDRLAPDGALVDEALNLAAEIAESAPLAVASIRATLRTGLADRLRDATARERSEQDRLVLTEDFAEGVQAMTERRRPQFKGR